jgi:hypothetical protein
LNNNILKNRRFFIFQKIYLHEFTYCGIFAPYFFRQEICFECIFLLTSVRYTNKLEKTLI